MNHSTWELRASPDAVIEKAPVFVAMVQDAHVSSIAMVRDDPISIVSTVVGLVCTLRNESLRMYTEECMLRNARLRIHT